VKDSSNGGWNLLSGCFREGCFRCNKDGHMMRYLMKWNLSIGLILIQTIV
jgi:hypothetical protein